MEQIDNNILNNHKQFRSRKNKLIFIFPIIAVIIAIIVFWWLKLVGITVTSEAFCGLPEHTHDETCYVYEIICDQNSQIIESSDLYSDELTENTHIHTQECEKRVLICNTPEHLHTTECFPDVNADIEKYDDWLKTFEHVELTNNIPENLVAIAMTQKGYQESKLNYQFDSDGVRRGYTRYGEWYGNPYANWNTLFVSFCLNYSNANDTEDMESVNAENMKQAFVDKLIYTEYEAHDIQNGDIIFFDIDSDGIADRTAIVLSTSTEGILTIEGDVNNSVDIVNHTDIQTILGFGKTSELYAANHISESETETSEIENEESISGFTQIAKPILMNNSGTPQPNITYVTDLTETIIGVTFKTQDGIILDSGSTVYLGQSYVVSLEFMEDNTGDEWLQFSHNDEHYLFYQIPEYLHCAPFEYWHPITAITENGTVEDVGKYFVDEHGFLRVMFFDDENGVCFGSRYSNVHFIIDFNATVGDTQSESTTEIEFGNEIKIELTIDGSADMSATKTHGTYDSDNHTVEYFVRIEATKGVIKNLIVDDEIWVNHIALRDTIIVTDLNGNILNPQPQITNHPAHNNGANEGFRLTGFPDIQAGEGFIITYKTQIYDELLGNKTVDMWNGLNASGEAPNGSTPNKYTQDWLKVELEQMKKNGRQYVLEDADGNPVSVIEWQVDIQKNNNNLQGTLVIDTLGDGLEYYVGKEIRIIRYDEYGNRLSDIYIPWSDVSINGSQMSFELPDGYAFNIVYYTTYEQLSEGETRNYSNTVQATINGSHATAGGNAEVVGFVPHVTKSASGNDGEYVYFTIEADIPGIIKDWGHFFLTDLAAFWGYENEVGYLYVENIPQDIIITAITESGNVINFSPYTEGGTIENTYILICPAEETQHHSFNILFNTSEKSFSSSKWILNEDAKLSISYKIPFDAKTGIEWEGELTGNLTLEDVLLSGKKMSNEVYLNYTDAIKGIGSTIYDYSPKIIKRSDVNDDGTIDYTVIFNNTIPGTNGNEGSINNTVQMLLFNDTFDERLEYVPESLLVTAYSPWQTDLWLAKYVYKGAVTDNTINVYAHDMILFDYNEEADQYGWNGLSATSNFRDYYHWLNAGGQYIFTYTLRIKDEYLYTTEYSLLEFSNTAELTWDNNGSSGPVTEICTFKTGLADKHVVHTNNKLEFDIHINRNALDILPGADTLTIEDTMTQNLSVYWDSIILLYEDSYGNWIDFDSPESIYTYSVTYDQLINKLTFVVPDSLHIRIDYTTLITESGLVSVNNSVKIDGKAKITDIIDAIFKVDEHSGGASGSIHSITLLKQDGETHVRLPNVSFHLYGPMGDPHANVPDDAPVYISSGNSKNLYYIGTYTTGTDGTVLIESQYLTIGGPYALVEVEPYEGYIPLDEPTYFYFYQQSPDSTIQSVTTIIAIENYTYSFVIPETGGSGTIHTAIIGISISALPILYSIIRRKRERRLTKSSEA